MPELLNTEEAAELLKLKPATLKYWRYKRKGPPYFVMPGSQLVLYTRESIERWLATGEVDHSRRRRPRRLHAAGGPGSGSAA